MAERKLKCFGVAMTKERAVERCREAERQLKDLEHRCTHSYELDAVAARQLKDDHQFVTRELARVKEVLGIT